MAIVMIADDAAVIRKLCSGMLRAQGYSVIEAHDGHDAIQKYQEYRPDVVLLDIRMPDLDGIAALKQIKQVDPKARVGMVTAGTYEEVEQAIRAGAGDFVLKPFDRTRILTAVEKLLR